MRSGLFALMALSACTDSDPGPVSTRVEGYVPPIAEQADGERTVVNLGPREGLHVYEEDPRGEVRLVFMGGRAATFLGEEVGWPDLDAGRVLLFDRLGIVSGVLQGTPESGRSLARPAFVASDAHGSVWAVEADGSALRFRDGNPEAWEASAFGGPVTAGTGGTRVATRTVLEFDLAPLGRDAPLFWAQIDGQPGTGIGRAVPASQPFLGPLANAGWATVVDDGGFVYASALRPELRRYGANGSLEWISRWLPADSVAAPRLRSVEGQVSPIFSVLQYAVAEGPDGLTYVLAASSPGTRDADLLLGFDGEGTLVRAGPVEPGRAVFVARSGHVFTSKPERVLARTKAPERVPFEPFDLPSLGDGAPLRLEQHRGKVIVVNFWASWCGPCRREMPKLNEFALAHDDSEVVVLGLNEDIDPDRALQFLTELGGVDYANARGGGRLRDRYRYRGLPYTVILDADLQEVQRVYGFGTTIEPIREAVDRALGRDAT